MQKLQSIRMDQKLSSLETASKKKLENKLTYQNPNVTGLTFKQQKKLNKAIKNARILGMYPFTMPLI